MTKRVFHLVHGTARQRAAAACQEAPEGHVVIISEPTRTLEQNAALWPLLEEIAEQVEWCGMYLTPDDWKDVLSAALHGQRSVPNIDKTGFVILGRKTSKMGKKEFSDLLELANAFAAQQGVVRANP